MEALIWSKNFDDISPYLHILGNIISYFSVIHTTYAGNFSHLYDPNVYSHIIEHGVLPRQQFIMLLERSRVLIGLGSPLDGPTALEAISLGCVFINPLFIPPLKAQNHPTRFQYTSQHPFAEVEIGPPHVYTINIHDIKTLYYTLNRILNQTIDFYIHPSFTAQRYIDNLATILKTEDLKCKSLSIGKNISRISDAIALLPKKHPANNIFKSYIDYVSAKCDSEVCLDTWIGYSPCTCRYIYNCSVVSAFDDEDDISKNMFPNQTHNNNNNNNTS